MSIRTKKKRKDKWRIQNRYLVMTVQKPYLPQGKTGPGWETPALLMVPCHF